jgi:hypothetical protein
MQRWTPAAAYTVATANHDGSQHQHTLPPPFPLAPHPPSKETLQTGIVSRAFQWRYP